MQAALGHCQDSSSHTCAAVTGPHVLHCSKSSFYSTCTNRPKNHTLSLTGAEATTVPYTPGQTCATQLLTPSPRGLSPFCHPSGPSGSGPFYQASLNSIQPTQLTLNPSSAIFFCLSLVLASPVTALTFYTRHWGQRVTAQTQKRSTV